MTRRKMDFLLLIALLTWQAGDINAQEQSPEHNFNNAMKAQEYTEHLVKHQRNYSFEYHRMNDTDDELATSAAIAFLGWSNLNYTGAGKIEQEICQYLGIETERCLSDQFAYKRIAHKVNGTNDPGILMRYRLFYNLDEISSEENENSNENQTKSNENIINNNISSDVTTKHEVTSIKDWYQSLGINFKDDLTDIIEETKKPFCVVAGYGFFDVSGMTNFWKCSERYHFIINNTHAINSYALQKIGLYNYGNLKGAKFVEITRKLNDGTKIGMEISLFIILPDVGNRLEDVVNEEMIREAVLRKDNPTNVRITLPDFNSIQTFQRFKNSRSIEKSEMLSQDADPSVISNKNSTRLRDILQVVLVRSSSFDVPRNAFCQLPPVAPTLNELDFTVDRPFMMIVVTKNEPTLILFVVQYTGIP